MKVFCVGLFVKGGNNNVNLHLKKQKNPTACRTAPQLRIRAGSRFSCFVLFSPASPINGNELIAKFGCKAEHVHDLRYDEG